MTSLSDGLGPQKDPNSGRTRVHSHRCKDSFHGTDVLAVSEHGHPRALRRSPKGGRPRYTAGPRRRSTLIAFRVAVRTRKESGHDPPGGGSLWPTLGGSVWVTLPGSRWATPGGSASPTPVAHL